MMFDTISIVGIGMMGACLARDIRRLGLAKTIKAGDIRQDHCDRALELGLVDQATTDLADSVKDADFVLVCVPVGACGDVGKVIAPALKPGALVTDIGSTKQSVIRDFAPLMPEGVAYVPGHPIAGSEKSGPEAGRERLFEGRWSIITPLPENREEAVEKLKSFWQALGANVEIMDAAHHDHVLAITSHLPHLISYTIVATAVDLESDLQSEVIKYSAGGFRDFTRLAGHHPVMWRDIFLNNQDAVLDVIQRFEEDLTAMRRAIRRGDAKTLEDLFTRTRDIRNKVIAHRQDE